MIELAQLQAKRPSRLFSKPEDDIGHGHRYSFRVQSKALAAAALDVFLDTGLT
jgi:hypothetical protein